MSRKTTQIALLRGINVGGHHKLPMAELKKELSEMGLENPRTLLNSGNAVFETTEGDLIALRDRIEKRLSVKFGFPVPVVLTPRDLIIELIAGNPFDLVEVTTDIRLYVSFLKEDTSLNLILPWFSPDKSFRIIAVRNRIICSLLDLAVTNTPKGMEELEKMFGKDITTRNWNTILKLAEI